MPDVEQVKRKGERLILTGLTAFFGAMALMWWASDQAESQPVPLPGPPTGSSLTIIALMPMALGAWGMMAWGFILSGEADHLKKHPEATWEDARRRTKRRFLTVAIWLLFWLTIAIVNRLR